MIHIDEGDDRSECRVTRLGKEVYKERRCYFMKELENRSVIGACSCMVPNTDALPCHHMVAVVKSSRIDEFTPTNAMPYWWSTECWRSQHPADINVTCDFDMDTVRASKEERAMIFCPSYAATKKTGHPKIDKQIKCAAKGERKERKLKQQRNCH